MSCTDFETRCRASFDKQQFMRTLGALLTAIRPGEAIIELPYSARLTQQHGFLHAGVVTTIIDTACGYAALSMMAAGAAVLTAEFKVNLMKPAAGSIFRATGKVLRAGKTLTVTSGIVEALNENTWSTIAAMQATMMAVTGRANLED